MRIYLPTEKAKKQIEDWIRDGAGYDEYQKNMMAKNYTVYSFVRLYCDRYRFVVVD